MKKSNPILNVLTAILASVGGCTAVLSSFIIFHAVFIGEFGVPDNKSATRENALIQSGSIPQENASIQSSSLLEGFSLPLLLPEEILSMTAPVATDTTDVVDHAESQPLEAYQAETDVDSIPLKYYQALNRANAYSDTLHMPKADIYEQLISAYGDYFSADAAQYAVDHLTNVWEPEEPEPVPAAQDNAEMASSDMTGQAAPAADENAGQPEGETVTAMAEKGNASQPEAASGITTAGADNPSQPEAASGAATAGVDNLSQPETMPDTTTAERNNVPQPEESVDVEGPSVPEPEVSVPAGTLVWLSATGEKYHRINDCGRMNPDRARRVTLEEALRGGFGQCKNCY